jgi:cytochrome c oxidase cbb3-type subunit I/II
MSADQGLHRNLIEARSVVMAVLTTVCISIGGLVEIVPMFGSAVAPAKVEGIEPYTPLEVAGRDIYMREGCYVCHSQMVRPFRSETLRYGEWSRGGEYAWDHPFLLGSRRTGPDLARVGGKWDDDWHYRHMKDPRLVTAGSIMPSYEFLTRWSYDPTDIQASMTALSRVGLPYTAEDIANAPKAMDEQAQGIVDRLAKKEIVTTKDKEIVALIAYLQNLGVDGTAAAKKASQAAQVTP